MEPILVDTFRDAQTAILSVAAAFGGSLSERLGSIVISRMGGGLKDGFGQTGLRFVVRAVLGATIFTLLARQMPATSQNIFFSIVFFAANPSLVKDAVTLGQTVTAMLFSGGGRVSPLPPQYAPGPYMSGKGCSSGSCHQ